MKALGAETNRGQSRSSYRRHHHVPAFCRAVTDRAYRERLLDSAFRKKAWWFGINNGARGHMQLDRCRDFLRGREPRLVWPVGHSKPKKPYAAMHAGDDVLFWTGQGSNPSWGLIGAANIGDISSEHVVLHDGYLFPKPLTPYPKGQPAETAAVAFLFETLGEEFAPLGDVRCAVFGTRRRPPVTVAPLPAGTFEAVLGTVARG